VHKGSGCWKGSGSRYSGVKFEVDAQDLCDHAIDTLESTLDDQDHTIEYMLHYIMTQQMNSSAKVPSPSWCRFQSHIYSKTVIAYIKTLIHWLSWQELSCQMSMSRNAKKDFNRIKFANAFVEARHAISASTHLWFAYFACVDTRTYTLVYTQSHTW